VKPHWPRLTPPARTAIEGLELRHILGINPAQIALSYRYAADVHPVVKNQSLNACGIRSILLCVPGRTKGGEDLEVSKLSDRGYADRAEALQSS
jgi:hypothetical protein